NSQVACDHRALHTFPTRRSSDLNPEHRSWLDRMAGELVSEMDSSGAIREKLGSPDCGFFGAPASNEEYGVTEAPVIQQDGDPARSEEHTSELQSRENLVCRLLLE